MTSDEHFAHLLWLIDNPPYDLKQLSHWEALLASMRSTVQAMLQLAETEDPA